MSHLRTLQERISPADRYAAIGVVVASVLAAVLAWQGGGVEPTSWFPYALVAGMLVAGLLAATVIGRPSTLTLVSLGAFGALAAWQAVAVSWSPFPSVAEHEARLTVFYGLIVAGCALAARTPAGRLLGAAAVASSTGALAAAAELNVLVADDPRRLFFGATRFASPIDYPNAVAALFLVGFWPAVVVASHRTLPSAARALASGAGALLLAAWLMTQSRGAFVALVLSAIVVLTVARFRLRLLPPLVVSAAPAVLAYRPLTEPFRAAEEDLVQAIHGAAGAAFAVAATAALGGLLYALVDKRVSISARTRRAATMGLALVAVAGLVAGIGALMRADLDEKWRAWTHPPETEGSSYLLTVGSNRYDVWRVALDEFREHRVAGIGTRGYLEAYLVEGRRDEIPHRAHSFELDALSETGIVGLVLVVVALAPLGIAAVRDARRELTGVAALGTGAYWLVHASGDWILTVPAVTIPALALLAASLPRTPVAITPRTAAAAGAIVLILSAVVFVPPWLSSRLTARALDGRSEPAAVALLDWARRLDPLAVRPFIAEASLQTPEGSIAPLRRAVEKEPRNSSLHYLLGRAYLDARRPADAVRELSVAHGLAPRSRLIERTLRSAERERR